VSTITPYAGRVILTDRGTAYPDASDHNAVHAKLHIGPDTNAQVLTFNVRRYAFDLGTPYDWDKYRDHECAQLIHESGASVVALQECEPQQDAYLATKLPALTGVPWSSVSAPTNVGLMYKADRWRLLATRSWLMDNGADKDRRLVLTLLGSIRTGRCAWFGSTHFGVGSELASWRRYQAEQVVMHLKNVLRAPADVEGIADTYFGDVRKHAVIMGDFNDWAPESEPGVRRVFAVNGMYDLRARLTDAQMSGDSYSTKHTFGKATPHDGRQIDMILTAK